MRVDRMRASRWQWHLDEMFVKINRKQNYLWRAVDHEGEVLESFVTETRDREAALKFCERRSACMVLRSSSRTGTAPTGSR